MELLQTKFHSLSDKKDSFCERIRLIDPDNHYSVTLLSAPAGFGKSVLLSQWIGALEGHTAFLSLDDSDNHPQHFWIYFVTAINRIFNSIGQDALTSLSNKELPEIESCLINLINDLSEWEHPLTIILDDLHVIENMAIYNGLDFFIDNIPDNIKLILSTREDPPISLGRLRARGKLAEIRQRDIRFDYKETSHFLRKNTEYLFSDQDYDSIYKRTEGWITGLQLFVSALKHQENGALFIQNFSGSHVFIFDYLMEEVLSLLDDEIQSFLLESSLFRVFNTSLMDEYLRSDTSRKLIKYISQSNLFLISLDDKNCWYRYHHLFKDFLLNRLEENSGKSEIKKRYIRAFDALKESGQFDDAFIMGIKGEEWQKCIDLLLERAPSYFRETRVQDLEDAIKKIPEDLLLKNADLYAIHLWNNLDLEKDERIFTGEISPFLEGVYEVSRGYQLFYEKSPLEECRRALKKGMELIPKKYEEIHHTCRLFSGSILRFQGNLAEAEKIYLFDLKPDRFKRRFYSSLLQSINRFDLHIKKNEISYAKEILDESFRLIEEMSGSSELTSIGYLWVQKASLFYLSNDLSKAYNLVRKGVRICRLYDQKDFQVIGMILQIQIELALNLLDEAEQTYRKSLENLGDLSPVFSQYLDAYCSEIKMIRGESVHSWANKSRTKLNQYVQKGQMSEYLYHQYIIYTNYLIRNENYKEAEDTIGLVTSNLMDEQRVNVYISYQLRLACIKYRMGFLADANIIMKEILKMNGSEQNLRAFLDAGEECSHLLSEAGEKGYLPDFLKQYAIPDQRRKKVHLKINNFQETFNDREMDIIKCMGEGLSNQEIGDKIFLSINTVRWYARQIYSKLDVKRRGEVSAKAKSLGLI